MDEIRKVTEYPDRRIKPIVYTMVSSGIRVGAWDYLKWSDIVPVIRRGRLIAAKIIVYAGEDDQYFSLITPEAYRALESWMKYRNDWGEDVTGISWVMRDLWYVARPRHKGEIQQPNKLQSVGVKRLMERALWAQGVRTRLEPGKKRYQQTSP
jgi:hypothetical protein